MHGKGEIDAYHNSTAADVKKVLGRAVTFRPTSGEKWGKAAVDQRVVFELYPEKLVEADIATKRPREGGAMHIVSVLPLCDYLSRYGGQFWVSWREVWLRKGPAGFFLLNGGWTLFEGRQGDPKQQVLRAEWDQQPYQGSARAGHPHWHFDDEIFAPADPSGMETGPSLIELTAADGLERPTQVQAGFIHLAMGAWTKNAEHPKCWQRTYEGNCEQLREWCVRTLEYLKDQIA